jgi:hypothetical protein
MKDLMSLAHTGSVSDSSITTVMDNISIVNPVVPKDLSPVELLVTLSEDKQLRIYYQCRDKEDPT